MQPGKTDLRYIRTEKRILDAFTALLDEYPLEKITVAELSRTAEINKGTFYLHYKNIEQLAESFMKTTAAQMAAAIEDPAALFTDPQKLVNLFFDTYSVEYRIFGKNLRNNGLLLLMAEEFVEAVCTRIENEGSPKKEDARLRLGVALTGIIGTVVMYPSRAEDIRISATDVLTYGLPKKH